VEIAFNGKCGNSATCVGQLVQREHDYRIDMILLHENDLSAYPALYTASYAKDWWNGASRLVVVPPSPQKSKKNVV